MQKDYHRYIKHKQRWGRFWFILVLIFLTTAAGLLLYDYNQSFEEPYNKGYQPMDQIKKTAMYPSALF